MEPYDLLLWLFLGGLWLLVLAALAYIGDKLPDQYHQAFIEAIGGVWNDREGD